MCNCSMTAWDIVLVSHVDTSIRHEVVAAIALSWRCLTGHIPVVSVRTELG
jgi:hypothetical protein